MAIPKTSFLSWTFFAISYSALTFYSFFLGCGENIDPQKEVTEETLTPQNEAKSGKVKVKKTVLMPNWNYSEISKVNSGKFFFLYMPQVKSNKTNFWFYLFLPSVSDSINPPKSQDEKAERIKKIKKILYSMWNMHIYKAYNFIWCFKVQFFWEGHKNVRNRPYGFD